MTQNTNFANKTIPDSLLSEAQMVNSSKWTYSLMRPFKPQYILLSKLFQNIFPNNTDPYEVYVKVNILNQFYNTWIFAITKLSQNITKLNVDSEIKLGNISAVENIAKAFSRKNYSFASKYCAMHNPAMYPINDRIVRGYLSKVIAAGNLSPYYGARTIVDAKMRTNYSYYKSVYDAFRERYNLKSLDYQEIDAYIWLACKQPELTKLNLFKLI